ncbi:MerR family transcriptional regulator [Vulgatibacter sp.]|uniref:MerR family transcriptional regulator n=1 Tax=Vulgatibacter sp. TaxID=1971226 RepID=UPI0035631A7B
MADSSSTQATGATLSTGDLARRTGTTLRTVRFYEEAGMLKPSAVGKGGRRLYTERDLEKLALITDLRELDLSLEEIKGLLRMREGCHDAPQLVERFGSALSVQLERTQRRLAALQRLGAEFAAALQVLGGCRACATPLEVHACSRCDVMAREETPRIIKVVVGDSQGEGGERS